MKVCTDCHTTYRPGRGARRGRCVDCERARNRALGTRQERGYDAAHQAQRAKWEPLVATGGVKCWRCREHIAANEAWDLGHDDRDRTKHRGPEHVRCNRATSGRIS